MKKFYAGQKKYFCDLDRKFSRYQSRCKKIFFENESRFCDHQNKHFVFCLKAAVCGKSSTGLSPKIKKFARGLCGITFN